MLKHVLLAGAATIMGVAVCAPGHAWAQANTITENINNTGIPRQTPSLGLGQIYGLNPCATGATAGITTPLFGIAGAISDIDRECETRNNAAVVVTALKDESMAREILCQIKDVREAAIRMGKPCIQDQPDATRRSSASAPVPVAQVVVPPLTPSPVVTPAKVAQTDTAQQAAPALIAAGPPPTPRINAPAFCYHAGLDLQLYPDCLNDKARPSVVMTAFQPTGLPHPSVRHVPVHATHVTAPTGTTKVQPPPESDIPARAVTEEPAKPIAAPAPAATPQPSACNADCEREAKANSELGLMRFVVQNEIWRRALEATKTRLAAK